MIEWEDEKLMALVNDRLDEALKEGAEIVKNKAQQLVPKRTGNLRDKIKVNKSEFEQGGYLVEAQPDVTADGEHFYAAQVELGAEIVPYRNLSRVKRNRGTKRIKLKAQPFMRPAVEQSKAKIMSAVRSRIS